MDNEKAIALKRGRYIAQKRKLMRMTSGHAAGLLGVSNATYSKCERRLSDTALEKYGDDLATILGVSKEDISMGGGAEGYSASDERQLKLGELGARAKARREALGKTRLTVCGRLNVHYQTLALWEERLPRKRKDDVEVPWEQELEVPMGWLRDMSMQATEVGGKKSNDVDLSQFVDSISAGCKNVSEEIEAIGAWLCRQQPYKRTVHLSKLDERERTLVEMFSRRYGVYGDEASTLQVVGDQFKLTRERVRQIIQKMMDRASNLTIETPH